jgi:malic enzyme
VGEACTKYHRQIFSNPLGMYLSAFKHRGKMADVLRNWPSHNVQIIVVTDGSRILGLGDLGINGVGISIGKCSLFVAGAGFSAEHALPLVLDCGTNNQALLDDPFYTVRQQMSCLSIMSWIYEGN